MPPINILVVVITLVVLFYCLVYHYNVVILCFLIFCNGDLVSLTITVTNKMN